MEDVKSPGSTVDAATEARAIAHVVQALEALDSAAITRVLDWAWKRYALSPPDRPRDRGRAATASENGKRADDHIADLAALYSAAAPTTDSESVLAAAYWHQVLQGAEYLDSQTLNTDLKQLGHGVGNVTRACSTLIEQKPALMIQVKKSGSTKQARKQYRLTSAGVQRVRERLTQSAGGAGVVR
jgi:hypothetical protein